MDVTDQSRGSFLRISIFIAAALALLGAAGYAIYESRDLFLSSAPLWKWGLLFAVIFSAVTIDLLSHKGHSEVTIKNSAIWSVVWACVAIAFGVFVAQTGTLPFGETFSLYLTGWALEMTLALDNLFVIAMIFGSFGLMTKEHQPIQLKILYYGILGMVLMRILFLSFGAYFINLPSIEIAGISVEWPMLVFAAIIGYAVLKMSGGDSEEDVDYSNHWSVRATRWVFPINPTVAGGKFFTPTGVSIAFLCLICIEMVDFMFAFDSMPVIIAVVKDPFLMAASNLMACCGLRSLYFVLIAARNKLWALDAAVRYLLMFIAVKLTAAAFGFHIPALLSLTIVATFILGGIAASFWMSNPHEKDVVA